MAKKPRKKASPRRKGTRGGGSGIAYQNKDIVSKALAEKFQGKTFRAYGLDLPEIRNVLPTDIPAVRANELRIDSLFELADRSAAILDYESDYDEADKVKYLNYLDGIANRCLNRKERCPVLHMVVIYTGDIDRGQVSCEYDIGALKMKVEPAFLSEMDGDGILGRLGQKIEAGEPLDDEDMMQMIVSPLSYRTKDEKVGRIRTAVDLASRIRDEGQQLFVLAGMLAFTDKVIDQETADKIRRKISMTKVAQIFEEEKQQALREERQKYKEEKQQALREERQKYKEEKQQALREERQKYKEEKRQTVLKMIWEGYPSEKIASFISGYTKEDVDALRETVLSADAL